MRILYLSQYFPPEIGATQNRAHEICTNLRDFGHSITVIAEVPNHPSGIIKHDYKNKLYKITQEDGLEVIRVWVKTSPVKNFLNRMLFYLSYMINAILAGILLARQKYDLIYSTSPPLFVGGTALVLSRLKKIPFVFEVRDLWPESAVALGELTNPRSINLATRLEESCYQNSTKIIVVTNGIQEKLLDRGIPKEKIILIPNGSNVDNFCFKPEARKLLRKQLQLEDQFVLVYAGIFGLAQGLETIVNAAELLKDIPDIHFLLIGDGPIKSNIQTLISELKLANITLLPSQPYAIIPDYISASDAAIVPLRKVDLFRGALPSKIFDAWACERPLLLCIDGEARLVLESSRGGIYVPPENPQLLSNSILELKQNSESRLQMGKNGRNFVEKYYSRKRLAIKLNTELSNLINHN